MIVTMIAMGGTIVMIGALVGGHDHERPTSNPKNLLAVQGKSLWTAALFQTLQLAIRHFLRGGNAKLHYQPMA